MSPLAVDDELVLEGAEGDIAAHGEEGFAFVVDLPFHFLMVLPAIPLADQFHFLGQVLL